MKWHRAHITGALDVVLPAQWVETGAVPPDVTCQKSKMNQRQGRGCAMRELGDTHAPVDRCILCGGIHARGFADIFRRHTGNLLGILGCELFQ